MEYFENERGVFSDLRDNEEPVEVASSQEYIENEKAHFGKVDDEFTVEGDEQTYFTKENAAAGEVEKTKEMEASQHRFFKKEDAEYGDMIESGRVEKEATAMEFFEPEDPQCAAGDVENRNRSKNATEQNFF